MVELDRIRSWIVGGGGSDHATIQMKKHDNKYTSPFNLTRVFLKRRILVRGDSVGNK
jgi:hypothetical protein